MKKLRTDLKENLVKPLVDKRVMKTNKILSSKYTILIICTATSIFLSIAFNFICNTLAKIPSILYRTYQFEIKDILIPTNKYTFFFLLFCLLIINIRMIYLFRISYKDYNIGQKGVAKWTTFEEIKNQYKEIPEKDTEYKGKPGVPICRHENKIYIDDSPVNNLIIGITRSGKGEMYVFPSIDIYSRAEQKSSMIITDPKLELFSSSFETLKKRGYDVHVLNLINPLQSMGFNPLQLIIDAYKQKKYSQAELLCSSFCYSIFNPDEGEGDSQFWANNSTYLLSALILAHVDDCLSADIKGNEKRKKEHEEKIKNFLESPKQTQTKISNIINIQRAKANNVSPEDTVTMLGLSQSTVNKYWDSSEETNAYELPEDEFIPTNENEKKITMYSILNTFSTLAREKIDEFTTALDIYFRERPDLDRAKMKYSAIELAGDKTKGSIFSNTLSKLTIFTYEEIAKMTAQSTINLVNIGFGEKPVAIFLGIPDYDRSNHFIASVFIRQLYFILAKTATMRGGKCTREVVFLLDEFGNLPAIEGMANIVTVCLGRNIRFNLIIQAYSQIEKLYGKDSETIIGNCGNQIYILTNDLDTAEHFSSLLGNETIVNVNRSGNKLSLDKSFTEMYDEKPLINPNELMELLPGECIVKRVMKREDLGGESVAPTSIFNKGETAFKYRYKYLLDSFPNVATPDYDGDINFDVMDELFKRFKVNDNTQIDLKERVFDIRKFFADKQNEQELDEIYENEYSSESSEEVY